MMSRRHLQRDNSFRPRLTPGLGYDFNSHPPSEHEEPDSCGNEPTDPKIIRMMNPWWSAMSLLACVIAVSMDPLFFYIPYIDNNKKCLGMDKDLRNAALISRSLTDITIIVHIIYLIRTAIKTAKYGWEYDSDPFYKIRLVFKNLSWGSFLTDILAILPIPQVLMAAVFFKMKGPRYLEDIKAVTFFTLVQYLPRIYRIYLSSINLGIETTLWFKGSFNFFLYMIASHILGAIWYFFSIQRVTTCWHQTYCKTTQGCATTYYCDNTAQINIPLINGSCPVSPPDSEKFDFGMFSDGLRSGNTGPISFSVKLFYTLWWGLRNLSNFGTSLETSTYVWENIFALLISVVGLILFSFLIGNMQQCMAWVAERKVERHKLKLILEGLYVWMDKNGLEKDLQEVIIKAVSKKMKEDGEFDVANLEDLFFLLPWYLQTALRRSLCMNRLRNVPELSQMDEKVLKMMCDYLKPVVYQENTMVFQVGEPLDRMVFINDGFLWTYTTATETGLATSTFMETEFLTRGDYYGHELLKVASSSPVWLPTSAANVRCDTQVEAFVLTVQDLRKIAAKCRHWWTLSYIDSQDDEAV